MLLSVDSPPYVEAHKRFMTRVTSKVGLLSALPHKDHDAFIFMPLEGVGEKRDVRIRARLAFVYDWLQGLLTGL
jgi:hypothetical protein